jgi:hypothetical protein
MTLTCMCIVSGVILGAGGGLTGSIVTIAAVVAVAAVVVGSWCWQLSVGVSLEAMGGLPGSPLLLSLLGHGVGVVNRAWG